MIRNSAFLVLGMAAWAGCGVEADYRPLPPGHPASPEAAEGSYVPPENLLKSEFPPPKSSGEPGGPPHHEHQGHGQAPSVPARPYPLSVCLVGGEELGKMGKPVVTTYEGREIKFCCPACIKTFTSDPAKYLKILDDADPKAGPGGKEGGGRHVHEEKKP